MTSNWYNWIWGGSSSSNQPADHNDSDYSSSDLSKSGQLLEGIEMAKRSQTRYKLIEAKRLNTETVAGIKDMNLGRVSHGVKRGNPVIRFDTGARTGHEPHINFDPRGYPSRKNLHLYVPQSMVSTAYYLQKTVEVANCFATVATYATDIYRLGSAAQLDYNTYYQAQEEIRRLETFYLEAKESSLDVTGLDTDFDAHLAFSYLRNLRAQGMLLEDMQPNFRLLPRNSLQEAGLIVGGYAGGFVGGSSGAFVGATAGATLGAFLGPTGSLVGSVAGAVIGSTYGGVEGARVGSDAAGVVVKKVVEEGLPTSATLATGAWQTAEQIKNTGVEWSSVAVDTASQWSKAAGSSASEWSGSAVNSASKWSGSAVNSVSGFSSSAFGSVSGYFSFKGDK